MTERHAVLGRIVSRFVSCTAQIQDVELSSSTISMAAVPRMLVGSC